MEAQNIYTKKMALFSYIASVEDDSMIDKLLNLINPSDNTTKKKNEATLKLSAAQKMAIDKGLKDIEDGNINRSAGFVILRHIQLKFTKKIYNISQ